MGTLAFLRCGEKEVKKYIVVERKKVSPVCTRFFFFA